MLPRQLLLTSSSAASLTARVLRSSWHGAWSRGVRAVAQTSKVIVYRYVASGIIEEKVMALKARKAELFAGVMDSGGFESASLSASDIEALLS